MSNRLKVLLGLFVIAILAVGGLGWYLGLFAEEEEAASVAEATAILDSGETEESSSGPISDLTGTWEVESSEATFVGYRVKEVLSSVGDFTAVGRTGDVTGTLVADGLTVTNVSIAADLSTLASNSRGRDGQLRRQGLETGTFPDGAFELTSPIIIDALPAEGEVFTTTATGELTLHGETQAVEVAIEGTIDGERIVIIGSMDILMSDFGITPPSAPVVASIEDQGIMELSLIFHRA